MAKSPCLSHEQLARLADAGCTAAEEQRWALHLEHCATCRDRLAADSEPVGFPAGWAKLLAPSVGAAASPALAQAMARLQGEFPTLTATSLAAAPATVNAPDTASHRSSDTLAFLAPTDLPDALGAIGKYLVWRVLGRGGMGVVLAALDTTLRRPVAIKVPSAALGATPDVHARFLQEARSIAAVKHDNIVTMYAVEEIAGALLLVMELVDGPSLADLLRSGQPLAWQEVARLGADVAAGLAAAHAQGIVHRDVKPGNILLEGAGRRAKVTDFGLAQAFGEASLGPRGVLAGTPEYMAPEQIQNLPSGPASDLFSLGAVLYHACGGVSPFAAASARECLRQVLHHAPPPLDELQPATPAWLAELIGDLLAKDPARRPASAEQVRQRLLEGLAVSRVAAQTTSVVTNTRPRRRSYRWSVVAAAFAVAGGLWATNSPPPRHERPQLAAAPSRTGDENFFVLPRTAEQFLTLSAALAAVDDGGVIEIHGNGPFRHAGATAGAKRITLRAAHGSRPLFLPETNARPADRPWLSADADLRLVGLDVQWAVASLPSATADELFLRCAVAVRNGTLTLENCRVAGGRLNGAVGVADGSAEISRTHLIALSGPCLAWLPGDGCAVKIRESLLEGERAAVLCHASAAGPDAAPLSVACSDSSFVTEHAFVLAFHGAMTPFEFFAERNAFDAGNLLLLSPRRRSFGAGSDLAAKRRILAAKIRWNESHNAFRRGIRYVARGAPGETPPAEVIVSSLEQWRSCWPQTPSQTAAAEFAVAPPVGDDQLRSGQTAGPPRYLIAEGQAPVGADPELVGPGAPPYVAGSGDARKARSP